MARMPALPFALANFSSSLLLSAVWVGTGYLAVTLLPQAEDLLARGTLVFAMLSVVLAVLYYLVCMRWKWLSAATLTKLLVLLGSVGLAAYYLYALRTGQLDAEWDIAPDLAWLGWLPPALLALCVAGMVGAWVASRKVGGLKVLRGLLIGAGSVAILLLTQWLVARVPPGTFRDPSLSSGPASAAVALAVVLAWWPHLKPVWRYLGLGFALGAGIVAWAARAAWPSDVALGWLLVGGWAAAVGLAIRMHDRRKERRALEGGQGEPSESEVAEGAPPAGPAPRAAKGLRKALRRKGET
jgi:hypothetical protein